MDRAHRTAVRAVVLCLGLSLLTSCGGKSWWPWGGKVSDDVPGIIPPREYITTIQKMGDESAKGGPNRTGDLIAYYPRESDPLIRLEIVKAVGRRPAEAPVEFLREATKDRDPDVRALACKTLGQKGGAQSGEVLRDVFANDNDLDVRLAAANGLGEAHDSASVALLGAALDEKDPAIQYQAVCSLRKIAPQDMGNDIERWRQYAKAQTPASSKPTAVAERPRDKF